MYAAAYLEGLLLLPYLEALCYVKALFSIVLSDLWYMFELAEPIDIVAHGLNADTACHIGCVRAV